MWFFLAYLIMQMFGEGRNRVEGHVMNLKNSSDRFVSWDCYKLNMGIKINHYDLQTTIDT